MPNSVSGHTGVRNVSPNAATGMPGTCIWKIDRVGPGDIFSYHRQTYGHPSMFGFKDVIHAWKAENWDPEKLVALYKRAGAQYFVAMANHHDNFDNFDSKYQPWNSVNMGPQKDLIGGWAKAARDNGLLGSGSASMPPMHGRGTNPPKAQISPGNMRVSLTMER